MNVFKWVAALLLTLLLLVALAIVIVPRVVDPNDFREEIISLVKQKTGRTLKLDGNLSVSIVPWLGIRTEGLRLSQPQEIAGEMLSVQTAQLRVKLMPLFSRQLEVDTIVLREPQLRIVTLKNGINSFSGLSGVSEQTDYADPGSSSAAIALVVRGLQLSNGSLIWDDRQIGDYYAIKQLNVNTGNLLGGELASLSLSGVLKDANTTSSLEFSVDGQARIDPDRQQIIAHNLKLDIQQGSQRAELGIANFDFISGGTAHVVDISIDAQLEVDDAASDSQTIGVSGVIENANYNTESNHLKAAGIDISLDTASLEQLPQFRKINIPSLQYNIESTRFGINDLKAVGEISGRNIILSLPNLTANLDAETVNIGRLDILSGDLSLQLSQLKVSNFLQNPQLSGRLELSPFNAAQLLKDLAVDYTPQNENALQRVGLTTKFWVGSSDLELSDMVVELDNSRLSGSFAARSRDGFLGGSPNASAINQQLKFDLELDRLNLDNYLPADDISEQAAGGPAVADASALAFPMALLKGVNANGSFKADQLISGGLELNAIDVQIVSTLGSVTIAPKANLYDGKLSGTMIFTENQNVSKLVIKNEINLISLSKFLQAADVSDQLSGIGSLVLDITVIEKNGVQQNQGTIKLLARNGAIQGVDIKSIVDRGYQQYKQLKGRNNPQDDEQDQDEKKSGVGEFNSAEKNDETRFAELLGTFELNNFKLNNNDFELKAPLFRIKGEGLIDLAQAQLDYLLRVSIVDSTDGQGGEALEKLNGVTIPIRLRGALLAPNYSLDMRALYTGLAKQEIEQRKTEYLQEKLGIEDGGKLSTKELLKQVLIEEVSKRDSDSVEQEAVDSEQHQTYRPSADGTPELVPDVQREPNAEGDAHSQAPTNEETKSDKQQAKEELLEKLLEGIFN